MKHPHVFLNHHPIILLVLASLPANAPVQDEAKGQKSYKSRCSVVEYHTFCNLGVSVLNLHTI